MADMSSEVASCTHAVVDYPFQAALEGRRCSVPGMIEWFGVRDSIGVDFFGFSPHISSLISVSRQLIFVSSKFAPRAPS